MIKFNIIGGGLNPFSKLKMQYFDETLYSGTSNSNTKQVSVNGNLNGTLRLPITIDYNYLSKQPWFLQWFKSYLDEPVSPENTNWDSMRLNQDKLQDEIDKNNQNVAQTVENIGTSIVDLGINYLTNFEIQKTIKDENLKDLNDRMEKIKLYSNALQQLITNQMSPLYQNNQTTLFIQKPTANNNPITGKEQIVAPLKVNTNTKLNVNVTTPDVKQSNVFSKLGDTFTKVGNHIKNANINLGDNKTVSGVANAASTAWGVALNLGLSTGNKTEDTVIGTGLGTISQALSKGGFNPYSLGINLGSSILGASSDNKYAQAGAQALGAAGTWIGGGSPYSALIGAADTALFGNSTPSEYSGKKGGITQGMDIAYDAAMTAVNAVPVIGNAASAIMAGSKFLNHGIKELGGGTDGMTTADAILGSNFGFLLSGGLSSINGFTGSTTTAYTKDLDIYDHIGGSYMGSNALADKVSPYAGKKFGGLSSGSEKKWDKKIIEALKQLNLLSGINNESQRSFALLQTMTGIDDIANQNKLAGGYDNYTTFAKHGAILNKMFGDKLDKAHRIVIKTSKTIIIEPAEEIIEGPKPTKVQMSIIPEGALHARLHHMEDDENITKKGIPVVDIYGDLLAEIERNEIIFCLDATKKLEEYLHDGSDDSAIKAGKLLVEEILEHTIDRTGLINTLKKGGEILFALDGTKTEEVIITPQELFNKFINGSDIPENLKDWNANEYHMMRLWELYDKPSNFEEALKNRMFESTGKYKKEYHAPSVGYNKETNEYEFLKSAKHPTIRKELNWYYSDDPEAIEFRNEYDLDDSNYPWYKYIPKVKEFKEGGSINVIPEGALHARKNNMEGAGKDFTHKGIPVIDINGEQQAEIELNEIIFRLEVTKKLEELSKDDDKDNAALKAGKLLVDEILNNTDDRTGLIQNV